MRISSPKNWRNRYLFVLSQNILNPNNKNKHKIRINQFFEQKKAEDACIIPYSFSEFKRKTNGIFGGMREIV